MEEREKEEGGEGREKIGCTDKRRGKGEREKENESVYECLCLFMRTLI